MLAAFLLRLYPSRWRARYGDEFEVLLAERVIGPFDVLDVALGALDAHLHLRGLGAASEHRKGFTMSLRIGGYAAILGSLLFFFGFLANTLDGTDDAWPTSGIILAGVLTLLVGIAGLSAFAARQHPALAWAAFLLPATGAVLMSLGLLGMGILGDAAVAAGLNGWTLGMIGMFTLLAGSALFALAGWRSGPRSVAGTVLLVVTAPLAVVSLVGMLSPWPWPDYANLAMFAMLVTFTGGWLLHGIAAVRADRPLVPATGAAA